MKRKFLLSSGVISFVIIILNWIGTFRLCGGIEYGSCMDNVFSLMVFFLPIIPFFIFSLITYKMREVVYLTWFNFAKWWIPFSMFLILIAPQYSHDWMFPINKGGALVLSSLIFVVASLILIAYKSYKLRGK